MKPYADIWTGPDSPFEFRSMTEALAEADAEREGKLTALAARFGMTREEFDAFVARATSGKEGLIIETSDES